MSVSVDNFLKTVYILGVEQGADVSGNMLATKLNISSAAVTDMVRKLSVKGLIDYTPYKEPALTGSGKNRALRVVRKHRLWELFLFEVLKMDLGDVHEEAELLEHQTSDELMNRLDQFLGYPRFDPHGEPIPAKDGTLPDDSEIVALSGLKVNSMAVIARVRTQEKAVFKLFDRYRIHPGTKIEVLHLFDFDGSVEVRVDGEKLLIPASLVKMIFCVKDNTIKNGD